MAVNIMLIYIVIAVVISIAMTWSVQALEIRGCGQRNFFGSSADNDEFPWVVKILKKKGNGWIHKCRGTLIHAEIVLTTAQCVQKFPKNPERFSVHVPDFTLHTEMSVIDKSPQEKLNISKIILHKDFQSEIRSNNFALLVLSRPVIFPENICLPDANATFDGHHCFIAREMGTSSDKMTRVELSVISQNQCQISLRESFFRKRLNLDQSLMCAIGKLEVNVCEIEEGIPLVCPILGKPDRYVQIGIASAGKFGCVSNKESGILSIYSNIASVRSWIDEQMQILEPHLMSDFSSYVP